MNKSNDEVRRNFLKTLKSRNLLSEKPSIKEQTSNSNPSLWPIFNSILVMIFDWDDTLLCTTFLGRLNSLVDLEYRDREKTILNKIDCTAVSLNPLKLQFIDWNRTLCYWSHANLEIQWSSRTQLRTGWSIQVDCSCRKHMRHSSRRKLRSSQPEVIMKEGSLEMPKDGNMRPS